MGWGVSKRTLSNAWSSLFLSARLHVRTQRPLNRQERDASHQQHRVEVCRSGNLWARREETESTLIKFLLSRTSDAQITVVFLSSAVYKEDWHVGVCRHPIQLCPLEMPRLWTIVIIMIITNINNTERKTRRIQLFKKNIFSIFLCQIHERPCVLE